MRRPLIVTLATVLALAGAGAALSRPAHRSPCHPSHSCPSDHHSYVWYDAAGQGWDCAKVGAPEVTAADTQTIYSNGLAYRCRRAGGIQTPTCGTEAWSLKTLSDPASLEVDRTPRATTVDALSALRPPGNLGTRMPGAEMKTWRIAVRLLWQKLEADSDVHLVVADPRTGSTMIVELPSAGCVGAPAATARQMESARQALAAYCGSPETSFAALHGTATIDGVGFFDFDHLQRGRARNLVELHPVLRFSPGRARC